MFTASKSALLDALKVVGQVVERRTTIPILQNIAFDRSGESLAARVSDLDIEAVIPFEADVQSSFSGFTVPAHMLADIVRKLPDGGDIRIEAAEDAAQAIVVKSGRSRFRLQTLPVSDFPSMAVGELPFSFDIPASALSRAIAGVSFAVSTEETRYYLNGIFMHPSPDGMKFVATDGHRLSKRYVQIENVPQDMPGIILPKKTVETISKNLPKEANVTVHVSDAKIRFTIGGMVLMSKLIDGTFPDYQRVIPNHGDFVEIEGKPLAAAIDRVATVAAGSRAMRFAFEEGVLKLSVNNPDAGHAEDEVPYGGTARMETGFNAKYVTDALNHLAETTVHMHLGETGAPIVLRSGGDHVENLIVLMPMRV